MLVALVGVGFVLGVSFSSLDWRGVSIAFIGVISFSDMIISMESLTKEVGAAFSNLLMTIWAMLLFPAIALIAPLTDFLSPIELPETMIGWFFILIVELTFAFGYLCLFVSANIIGASRASLLSTSEPVLMILCAVLLVGETLEPLQWVGVVVVIWSFSLSEVFRR